MSDNSFIGRATYSPEDNKLRIYPDFRLPKDVYQRVRNAGFIWAPKQELFVAAAWSPYREDFLIEMCGEIGDEDTTLVERAEERADRFNDYSQKRLTEANHAHDAVSAITQNIPPGQPIIVAHHSESRARRDAERIETTIRKAVTLWETSEYWTKRAKGALRHAKYKERPDVRARRISKIEADKRKRERTKADCEQKFLTWLNDGKPLTHERARAIANSERLNTHRCYPLDQFPRNPPASQYEGSMSLWAALGDDTEHAIITPDQAHQIALVAHRRLIDHCIRWINHYTNRLAYERAMLDDQGGLPAEKFDIQPGGMVLTGDEWATVIRVNRSNGSISSVTTNARYRRIKKIETIKDYKPPTDEDTLKVKNATALAPLCNYPGDGFKQITKAEWTRRYSDGKGTQDVEANETTARHRVRYFYTMYAQPPIQRVFITDDELKDPPRCSGVPAAKPDLPTERVIPQRNFEPSPTESDSQAFEDMRETLRAGIQVVRAPQLFPTSEDQAAHMVELLDPQPGDDILEPEAGTGALIKALANSMCRITAVEINQALADQLRARSEMPKDGGEFDPAPLKVVCADFLECNGNLGKFHRIIMNPPFGGAADIEHIKHAIGFLKPGGRLVALCANGPRQREQLQPLADYWQDLPPGSFSDQGTNVNVALLVINAPHEPTRSPEPLHELTRSPEPGWLF